MNQIIFLTGASGVGKTSIVQNLALSNQTITCLHFDSIEVPTIERMNADFGGPENWQKRMTEDWVRRLVLDYSGRIVFEGQVNIEFILASFAKLNFSNYKLFLVDCSDATMFDRLITERKQPELANQDMLNWLKFLRKQAIDSGISIINTEELSLEESCEVVMRELENMSCTEFSA